MNTRFKRRISFNAAILAGIIACILFYTVTHPLVFNESLFDHAHCIKAGGLDLMNYAQEHQGKFPFHANGYGDALLLIPNAWDEALTGPGYDSQVFKRVRQTGEDAPEPEFGRVYVQGLSETNNPNIALLFDKIPTPGGDHTHLFRRMFAPLGREVWTIGSEMKFIPETLWPSFSKEQIDLLVAAGISQEQAEWYYSEGAK